MVISKLVKKQYNNLIGYLDDVIMLLVLILPKMSGYVNAFKDRYEFKKKNNDLMSLHIDDNKLSEKCKTIWTMMEDLKKLNWMLCQFIMIDI